MAISHRKQPVISQPRRLRNRERTALRDFLVDDLDANLFALSWLENNDVEPTRPDRFTYWGFFDGRQQLSAVALNVANRLLMLDTRHPDYAREFANLFQRQQTRFRHVVSRPRSVTPFWSSYSRRDTQIPVDARLIQHQRMYRLLPEQFSAPDHRSSGVRRGQISELDAIFLASARMHREETLEDPLQRNSASFRRHVRHRVKKGRTFVWFDDHQRLVFKADISTHCSQGAQISGVYTDPDHRNQGLGTRAMIDICQTLFDEGLPRLNLYVNRANKTARHLYEKLGFQYVCPYQTVFVAH